MLISLLSEQSLAEVNRYVKKFGIQFKRPKKAGRAKVKEDKDFFFYQGLMQAKPKGGGYHQR